MSKLQQLQEQLMHFYGKISYIFLQRNNWDFNSRL
jgi:hypothetical protein